MSSASPAKRVFLYEEADFYRTRLSTIVSECGHDTVLADGIHLVDALRAAGPPLALMIVPFHVTPTPMLESLRLAREIDWLAAVPILGVSSSGTQGLDLWQLRALGVAGVVDRCALPAHVRFRVSQLVFSGKGARVNRRVLCDFPVKVAVEDEVFTARAITLSERGMGLSCNQALPVNTKVSLQFDFTSLATATHRVEGRIVHARAVADPEPRYETGLFFFPRGDAFRHAMAAEVARLLAMEG